MHIRTSSLSVPTGVFCHYTLTPTACAVFSDTMHAQLVGLLVGSLLVAPPLIPGFTVEIHSDCLTQACTPMQYHHRTIRKRRKGVERKGCNLPVSQVGHEVLLSALTALITPQLPSTPSHRLSIECTANSRSIPELLRLRRM